MRWSVGVAWLLVGCEEGPIASCPPGEGVLAWVDADADGIGGEAIGSVCVLSRGQAARGGDCADDDPRVFPGAPEACDGRDGDCDALIDEGIPTEAWFRDADGDGFGDLGDPGQWRCRPPGAGFVTRRGDCDDGDDAVNPDATERCDPDVTDEDCDGRADDEDGAAAGQQVFFPDADGDGFGDAGGETTACRATRAVSFAGDCDDGRPEVNPGAVEACNGRDDDCDGGVDEGLGSVFYVDADGDGWGAAATVEACAHPVGFAPRPGDCDDTRGDLHPLALETCDHEDDDCDGAVDHLDPDVADAPTWYPDADGDGFGDDAAAVVDCERVVGAVTTPGDCDDADPSVGAERDWWVDADADGVGAGPAVATSCSDPGGGSVPAARLEDCDDADAGRVPGSRETCGDGVDQDCTAHDADCQVWLYTLAAGNVERLDVDTGGVEVVGPHGMTGVQAGLAFDPVGRVLYAAGTTDLYTLDLATGAATAVGAHGQRDLVGLTWNPDDGRLYGVGRPSDLVEVDPATGAGRLVARVDVPVVYALAWDAVRHRMLGFQSSTGFLYEVSPSTGHTTPLHAGGPGPWLDPMSLAVDPVSDRYLGLVPDPFGATSVFAFDAADLAAPEDVWVSVPQAGFAGLVWVEDPPN